MYGVCRRERDNRLMDTSATRRQFLRLGILLHLGSLARGFSSVAAEALPLVAARLRFW
jgi:triphosphoribosyl-dephospho-CoA synthetase